MVSITRTAIAIEHKIPQASAPPPLTMDPCKQTGGNTDFGADSGTMLRGFIHIHLSIKKRP